MYLPFLEEPLHAFLEDYDRTLARLSELEPFRERFIRRFPESALANLTLEEYVVGVPGRKDTFCYWLEYELKPWGQYVGRSEKSGVFFHKASGHYRCVSRFGSDDDPEQAFINVRSAILALLDAGKREDIPALDQNSLTGSIKGRILGLYYPERYLNIYGDSHLDYFLVQLRLDDQPLHRLSELQKREILRDFKQRHPVMRRWPLHAFCLFLYWQFGRPEDWERNLADTNTADTDRRVVLARRAEMVPDFVDLSWEDMFSPPMKQGDRTEHNGSNFKKAMDRNKEYGDRGETCVLQLEQRELKKSGNAHLVDQVDHPAGREEHWRGYDILSFEPDTGVPKQIEVKSTPAKAGQFRFFLTENEYQKALDLENYYIYIVFEVSSRRPKVWQWKHPFKKTVERVKMEAVAYRVTVE